MDDKPGRNKIIEISADHEVIQQALNHASRDAQLMQKRVGFPIMILNYGKAAWIPTDVTEE